MNYPNNVAYIQIDSGRFTRLITHDKIVFTIEHVKWKSIIFFLKWAILIYHSHSHCSLWCTLSINRIDLHISVYRYEPLRKRQKSFEPEFELRISSIEYGSWDWKIVWIIHKFYKVNYFWIFGQSNSDLFPSFIFIVSTVESIRIDIHYEKFIVRNRKNERIIWIR